MAEKFTKFDPATMLETDDDIAVFMADAFESGDAAYIAKAREIATAARRVKLLSRGGQGDG